MFALQAHLRVIQLRDRMLEAIVSDEYKTGSESSEPAKAHDAN